MTPDVSYICGLVLQHDLLKQDKSSEYVRKETEVCQFHFLQWSKCQRAFHMKYIWPKLFTVVQRFGTHHKRRR